MSATCGVKGCTNPVATEGYACRECSLAAMRRHGWIDPVTGALRDRRCTAMGCTNEPVLDYPLCAEHVKAKGAL